MTDIYVDIEHSIPQKELFKFKELADLMDVDLQTVIETCMYERRDELLDMLKNNVPSDEQTQSKDTNDNSTKRTTSSSAPS